MTIRLDSTVRRANITSAEAGDGETMMFDLETGNYFGLGETGSSIWQLLEEPLKVDDLITQLLTQFDVTRELCMRDTLSFLQQLREQKLLDVTP